MVVADAAALVEYLLGRPGAPEVEATLRAHSDQLHAPHLLDLEITQTLRNLVRRGEATEPRAKTALSDLAALFVELHSHGRLLDRVWQLRENFTAYDASYVALAEAFGEAAVLVTADGRLARAARAHTDVEVVLVG